MIYDSKEYARLQGFVLSISVIAWAVILMEPGTASCCQVRNVASSLGDFLASCSVTTLAGDWALMLVAMMLPMLMPPIYHIWISSFARRRARSIALFVASYAIVWMAAGGVLVLAELLAKWMAPLSYWPAVVVGVIALVWQASPFKQRCLNRCHSHRALAAFGLSADRDLIHIGFEHGIWCVGSCWATMLFPMLLPQGHNLAMAAVTVLMFCERLDHARAPSWRIRGFGTAFRYLRLRFIGPRITPAAFPVGA